MKKFISVLLSTTILTTVMICGCSKDNYEPLTKELPVKITETYDAASTYVSTYTWDFNRNLLVKNYSASGESIGNDSREYNISFETDNTGMYNKINVLQKNQSNNYFYTYKYDDQKRVTDENDGSITFQYNNAGFDFFINEDPATAKTNTDGCVTSFDYNTDSNNSTYSCEFTLDSNNNVIKTFSKSVLDGETVELGTTLTNIIYDSNGENITNATIEQTVNGEKVEESTGEISIEYDEMSYPTNITYNNLYSGTTTIEIEYEKVTEKQFYAVTTTSINPFSINRFEEITLGDFNIFNFTHKCESLKSYVMIASTAITY